MLRPVGDRLAYDIAIDRDGNLIRIQVKCAWFHQQDNVYIVDARRTKTNRRRPESVFNSYGSTISLVESNKRQRKPRSEHIEITGIYLHYGPLIQ